jgi:hypothetical protein
MARLNGNVRHPKLIDLVILIVFVVVTVRITRTVSRESPIFVEFNQPTHLRLATFLYPLGPLILLIATWRIGFLAAGALAAACYIPGLVIARRLSNGFERAGTDRVKAAQEIASEAFVAALGGLIYVCVTVLLLVGLTFI